MSLFTKYLLPVILFLMTIAAAFVAAAEFVGGSLNMLLIMLAVLSAITTILAFRQSAERQRLDQRIHDINRPDASRDTEETADRALEEIEGRLNAAEASVYQLDLVLDAMNDAVILTDINGDIIRLNESAAQMLGYPPNLLFNEPIRTIIAKEHRDKFRLSDDKREVETIFVTRHAD
ncbi:MAG: PAS domain-containing protein, partial [Gammaproteobacteria bacterium]|nr:PAS domain-containing protein [Gammaproteobacteria bacterium]